MTQNKDRKQRYGRNTAETGRGRSLGRAGPTMRQPDGCSRDSPDLAGPFSADNYDYPLGNARISADNDAVAVALAGAELSG
jgi:hypothetical protein